MDRLQQQLAKIEKLMEDRKKEAEVVEVVDMKSSAEEAELLQAARGASAEPSILSDAVDAEVVDTESSDDKDVQELTDAVSNAKI
jgi:hypothetical protein